MVICYPHFYPQGPAVLTSGPVSPEDLARLSGQPAPWRRWRGAADGGCSKDQVDSTLRKLAKNRVLCYFLGESWWETGGFGRASVFRQAHVTIFQQWRWESDQQYSENCFASTSSKFWCFFMFLRLFVESSCLGDRITTSLPNHSWFPPLHRY